MNIIGIIAEYNPFHNGHIYHINKIKEKYPDSLVVLVLNGYFTQRGTISVLSKENKVNIALNNKIDLVVELPFVYGSQASDIFAYQSIRILNEFKIDYLIFGSESNNIDLLNRIVDIEEGNDYEDKVKEYLDEGFNYPTALAKALESDEIAIKPNDLLGISYIKAIRKINNKIIPETIERTNDYHDNELASEIVSASNIRERFYNNEDLSKYLPLDVIPLLENVSNENLFLLLKYKILTSENLANYLDVNEGIEYRLLKEVKDATSYEDFVLRVKTKRYTYNRINRMFLHILSGFTKKDNERLILDYIKILGFNEKGRLYLKSIRKDFSLPTTPPKDSLIFKYELTSVYLYEQATKKSTNDFDKKNIPIQKD